MKNSMFRAFLLLAGFTLGLSSLHAAVGQKEVQYTVEQVSGTVTLNGKPLEPGCKSKKECVGKVYRSEIPKIKMGKNSYLLLSGPGGKKYYYETAKCQKPPCAPVAVVIIVPDGNKNKFLLGTQADLDAILAIFNKPKTEHIQPKELNPDKQQDFQKVNAPQQQQLEKTKQVKKTKTGGGR